MIASDIFPETWDGFRFKHSINLGCKLFYRTGPLLELDIALSNFHEQASQMYG